MTEENCPLWRIEDLSTLQRVDARTSAQQARSQPSRVGFGEGWLKESVYELFRQQIARFRIIMTAKW